MLHEWHNNMEEMVLKNKKPHPTSQRQFFVLPEEIRWCKSARSSVVGGWVPC